jgi:hypothetical protein
LKRKTIGAICKVEGDTIYFPDELQQRLFPKGKPVLWVMNPDSSVLRTCALNGPSVLRASIFIPDRSFSDVTKVISSSISGLNILFTSENCWERGCRWEGYFEPFEGIDRRIEALKEKIIKGFEGADINVEEITKDTVDMESESSLSIAMVGNIGKDGSLRISKPMRGPVQTEPCNHVLSILILKSKKIVMKPLVHPEVLYVGLLLKNRPELIARVAMGFMEMGAVPLFTTGMCVEGNVCKWEGYIDLHKTKIYVEGKSKSEAAKDEFNRVLGALEGIKDVEYQELRV